MRTSKLPITQEITLSKKLKEPRYWATIEKANKPPFTTNPLAKDAGRPIDYR